jgi:hypothetical protein
MKTTMIELLQEYLKTTSMEDFEKSWAEVEALQIESPTVEEFASALGWSRINLSYHQPKILSKMDTVYADPRQNGIFALAA